MDFYKYMVVEDVPELPTTARRYNSLEELKGAFDDEQIAAAGTFEDIQKIIDNVEEDHPYSMLTVYEQTYHRYYWLDINLPFMNQQYYEFERMEELLREFDNGIREEFEEFEDFLDWDYQGEDYLEKAEKAEKQLQTILRDLKLTEGMNRCVKSQIVTVGHIDREIEETVFLKNPKC